MTKLFHVKIQVNKTKIVALFDLGLQENIIATDSVKKLGLEVCDHPKLYPLEWVHKDAELNVKNSEKLDFLSVLILLMK